MKKSLVVIVLAVFILQSLGLFVAMRIEQYHIRKSIKSQIKQSVPEEDLKVFIFSDTDLKKLEWKKDNEFRYRGNMYDIVRREINNKGQLVFYCINDKQETSLFARLDELVARQLGDDNQLPGKQIKVSKLFSNFFVSQYILQFVDFGCTLSLTWRYMQGDRSVFQEIPSPPPKQHSYIA